MYYMLLHKNQKLGVFSIEERETQSFIVNKETFNYLPLPLKRIVFCKEEFIIKEESDLWIVNEDGCVLMDMWLQNRQVPTRKSSPIKDHFKWMIENKAVSFNDNYWICEAENVPEYSDVKIYNYKDIDELYVVLQDQKRMYKNYNATLGGMLDKFWYVSFSNGRRTLKICKKTEQQYDILSVREIMATYIYKKQGYNPICNYEFVRNTKDEIVGCKCEAFTSEEIELVSAFDLLEQYNYTQVFDVYEKIIDLAEQGGAKRTDVSNYLDIQMIVDYLINNKDRHQENIGFLRDSTTLQILGPAPIYDSGSSREMENYIPVYEINELYHTFEETLKHVKNWSVINAEMLPTKKEIQALLENCKYMPDYKKEEFIDCYENRCQEIKKICSLHREKS